MATNTGGRGSRRGWVRVYRVKDVLMASRMVLFWLALRHMSSVLCANSGICARPHWLYRSVLL